MRNNPRIVPIISAFVLMSLLIGCTNLGYYHQAITGQLEILEKRQSIVTLINDPETSEELKLKLRQVQNIRHFASKELGLPDNGSFHRYADLKRKYVVWNVFATPEFSLDPVEWCFPISGCLSYRGYFREHDAEQFADELHKKGNDVYVAGIPAYSTLGWFDDPVLNTVIDWPQSELAGLIFHELAHQQVYIKGDTEFNESFAAMVEMEGVRRWLEYIGGTDKNVKYLEGKTRQHDFIKLVMRYREKLKSFYYANLKGSATPEDKQELVSDMRTAKQAILNDMQMDYQKLKSSWSGYSGYDAWMSGEVNNAKIASVSIYQQHVPAFKNLLKQHQGKLDTFYSAVREIGNMEVDERRAFLQKLASH